MMLKTPMFTKLFLLLRAAGVVFFCAISSACTKSTAASSSIETKSPASVQVKTVKQGELVRLLTGTATLEAEQSATLVSETGGEVLQILVEEGDSVQKGQILARIDAARARLQVAQQAAIENRLAHENARSERLLKARMISPELVERTHFDFAAQSAAVNLAKVQVAKSDIRAPFSGIITRRHIKPGQMLASNAPVFDLADFSSLQAQLAVPEAVLGHLEPGQMVNFRADAFPHETFNGEVLRTAAVVDAKSGTAPITIDVHESNNALRPGQFVRIAIELERIPDAILLPKSAIQSDPRQNTHVYVVAHGIVSRRDVVLGAEQGDQVQVLQGVSAGTEVVTLGLEQISDQAQVQIIPDDKIIIADQVTSVP